MWGRNQWSHCPLPTKVAVGVSKYPACYKIPAIYLSGSFSFMGWYSKFLNVGNIYSDPWPQMNLCNVNWPIPKEQTPESGDKMNYRDIKLCHIISLRRSICEEAYQINPESITVNSYDVWFLRYRGKYVKGQRTSQNPDTGLSLKMLRFQWKWSQIGPVDTSIITI